ncbi:MAG: hypothetical protein JSV02_09670 [Dehalococcoidia bacterium]|nr:MAG: hypothetical protein JSV02_09670 [Dehalococcoidia bacterium]
MIKRPFMLTLLLAIALIIGVVGCGTDEGVTPTPNVTPTITVAPTPTQTPVPTPTPMLEANYTTYVDDLNGFLIDYPEEWQTKGSTSTLFEVQAPEQCEGKAITFSIRKMELPLITEIETFFGPILSETFLSRERYFIYGERVVVSNRSAIKWVTSLERVEDVPLTEMSVYILDTRAAWTLNFITTFNCWRQYEDTFQYMVDSFQLL